MNTYTFDSENKTIKVHKDCKKCLHLPVCIFHKNLSELASTKTMYSMTEYLEHNNVLKTFEIYTSCRYYSPRHIHTVGESPSLLSDKEIIDSIIHEDVVLTRIKVLEEKYPEHKNDLYFFFSPETKTDINKDIFSLTLKTTNKEIGHGIVVHEETKSVSSILKNWKFIN